MTGDKKKLPPLILSVIFFILAVLLAIILFSYHQEDRGWFSSGGSGDVHNLLGVPGAWIANIILNLFGFIGFIFPFMLAWQGYLVYRRKQPHNSLNKFFSGFVQCLTILAGASILYLYLPPLFIKLTHGNGGVLGHIVGDVAIIIFGDGYGLRLILGIFILGITVFSGIAWSSIIEYIGKYTCKGSMILFKYLSNKFLNIKRLDASSESDNKLIKNKRLKTKTKPKDTISHSQKITPVYHSALPSSTLLNKHKKRVKGYSKSELDALANLIETVLNDFNVSVTVVNRFPGPVITQFELLLAPGVKVSRVNGLTKDLARGLSVSSVRVVDIIEGKSVIGLEIPNKERERVSFKDLIDSKEFINEKSPLTLILGKNIAGKPIMVDLEKMPHLLVAGTTGSGKSVAINAMILSLLFKSKPDKIRLIMIDPKMLELSVYDAIPHLLTPVVTDMKEASNALSWVVSEMERRYKVMSKLGVRNLQGFNHKIEKGKKEGIPILDPLFQPDIKMKGKQIAPELKTLPNIVVVIDELADMMMIVGKKVEELIARLAQKARAAGIHLVLATQRPSVDVLTGLIKANIPSRISFQVSSRIDSRTILNQGGAESLLGNGDMLYLPPGSSVPTRAHGAFVDDNEVHKVVGFLKTTAPPDYVTNILEPANELIQGLVKIGNGSSSEIDVLYDEAVAFVIENQKASISSVQKYLKVGYKRAARMIEDMETAGVISPPEHNGKRTVLVSALEA